MVGDDPWSWIEMFWGAEKCAKWKSGVMNETIVDTEKLYNVMTLAYHVSGYWDKAICAFRPISLSYDQKVLEISFHWLPCISKSIKRKDRVSTLHPFGEDMDKWPQEPVKTHGIMHVCTECPIRSGEIIELTTDDPVQYPLPTMELLLMRWHMSRIVALQGAANDEDEDV
ncbi:unnamed protein product [Penicillium salamii]|nr:unnamed protein product [Penicillium salamii]